MLSTPRQCQKTGSGGNLGSSCLRLVNMADRKESSPSSAAQSASLNEVRATLLQVADRLSSLQESSSSSEYLESIFLLRLSVEYDTREVSRLSFAVKFLLLSRVTILVSIGNILWFDVISLLCAGNLLLFRRNGGVSSES